MTRLKLLLIIILAAACLLLVLYFARDKILFKKNGNDFAWTAPDTNDIRSLPNAALVDYGRKLISNTAYYLGPKGIVAGTTNGMNCQNCHLDAGSRLWGNNYSAVAATYPKFRERSGAIENIYKRVNDCIERSLNGIALDTNSREMQSIAAYINWLGNKVPKNKKPEGVGISDLAFLNRAADTTKGQTVYLQKCQRCHGIDGSGAFNSDGISYLYPPLWGDHSYNTGAGLFRITRFAGFVKYNMPFGVSHSKPELTDEEAWDVAAFVNSQPRPEKKFPTDWPNIAAKPIDHPFGPYNDSFSETQHKYGPWPVISSLKNKLTPGIKP